MVYLVIIQNLYEIYYTVKGFHRFKNDHFDAGVVRLQMVVFPGPFPRHSFIVQYRPIMAVCTPCIANCKCPCQKMAVGSREASRACSGPRKYGESGRRRV
jgi:hypothetical protein